MPLYGASFTLSQFLDIGYITNHNMYDMAAPCAFAKQSRGTLQQKASTYSLYGHVQDATTMNMWLTAAKRAI